MLNNVSHSNNDILPLKVKKALIDEWDIDMNTQALQLHYKQTGETGDWVLLLHGLFGSGDNLGALAKSLADNFRVVQVDLRNHGRSPHADDMSLSALAADVFALQRQLGIERSHFVGHSLGGKGAMQLALNDAACVERLVVADIAPVNYAPHHRQIFAGLQSVALDSLQSRQQADQQLAAFVPEIGVRQFLLKSLDRDGAVFRWRFNLPVLAARYAQMQAPPTGIPFNGATLFIKGGNSDYILAEYEVPMRALFPTFELQIIEGTGHWLHGEQPEIFNNLVKRFLQK